MAPRFCRRALPLFGLLYALLTGAPAAAQYQVWMKTEPCATSRQDWMTVADRNPVFGASHYVDAPGSLCAGGCSLAAATAEADRLRALLCSASSPGCPRYENFCCHNWTVYRKTDGSFSLVPQGGTPGGNMTFERGDLCCEDAAAFAGFPATFCGGGVEAGGVGPGGGSASAGGMVGCYKDPKRLDLDGYLEVSANNTPQRCMAICRERGFAYAGVQYGQSCLCGNHYGRYGISGNCNMPCTGDPKQTCGGAYANAVFDTSFAPGAGGSAGGNGGGGNPPPPSGCLPIDYRTNADRLAEDRGLGVGSRLAVCCPADSVAYGTVFGTDVYTGDSWICSAAIHAGVLTPGTAGSLTIQLRGPQNAFVASKRHGVSSQDWSAYGSSFVFVSGNP